MTTRFKFRAKLIIDIVNQKKGEWLYWDLLDGVSNKNIKIIDTETVGMSTTCEDKNKKLIWEGDMVKISTIVYKEDKNWFLFEDVFECKWLCDGFGFSGGFYCKEKCIKDGHNVRCEGTRSVGHFAQNDLEVVGNKFQPNLLK